MATFHSSRDGGGATLTRISTTWLAIIGLWTLGLASITVATSTAPLAAEILVNWSLDVEAVLTQVLLVLLVGASLALGLLARSRVAFGLVLAIGLTAVAWWLDLLVARDPVAFHRLAVLIGASGLLVLTGLLLDASAFWKTPGRTSDDPKPMNPRATDRAWRPPR
jgi:hypothetical protein